MMSQEIKIREEIKKWIEHNRKHLPLSIDYWDVDIPKKRTEKETEKSKQLSFGKYNASDVSTTAFYKPQSRIIEI